jgi:hypothetical protein
MKPEVRKAETQKLRKGMGKLGTQELRKGLSGRSCLAASWFGFPDFLSS